MGITGRVRCVRCSSGRGNVTIISGKIVGRVGSVMVGQRKRKRRDFSLSLPLITRRPEKSYARFGENPASKAAFHATSRMTSLFFLLRTAEKPDTPNSFVHFSGPCCQFVAHHLIPREWQRD